MEVARAFYGIEEVVCSHCGKILKNIEVKGITIVDHKKGICTYYWRGTTYSTYRFSENIDLSLPYHIHCGKCGRRLKHHYFSKILKNEDAALLE